MALTVTTPYGQHVYMGAYSSSSAAGSAITGVGWTVADGNMYYDTTSNRLVLRANSAWEDIYKASDYLNSSAGAGDAGKPIKLDASGLLNVNMIPELSAYAKLAGRSGGQTLYGGTAASENLVLDSTSHATKGVVQISGSDLDMNTTNKIINLAAGTDGTDAVNKNQLDNAINGLTWKDPVEVRNMISDADQSGSPPAIGTAGDTYVVNNWGVSYNDGDIIESDGSSWATSTVVVANSGGEPPDGTRVVCKASGCAGSFTGEENYFQVYDATGDSWTGTAPVNGDAVLVDGDGSVYENQGFTYDSTPGVWVQFAGSTLYTGGTGIDITGSVISIDDWSLNSAYDNLGSGAGRVITVDAGAVEFTGSNAGDYTVEITNSANGGALFVNNGGTGNTVDFQDSTNSVFKIDGNAALTTTSLASAAITTSGVTTIDANGASYFKTTSGNLTLQTITSGTLYLTSAGNLDATCTGMSLDATASSNITTTGSGNYITLEAAGGGVNQVIINSAGTGQNAIHLNASAGGIDIDSAKNVDIDLTGTGSFTVNVAGGNIALIGDGVTALGVGFSNGGSQMGIDGSAGVGAGFMAMYASTATGGNVIALTTTQDNADILINTLGGTGGTGTASDITIQSTGKIKIYSGTDDDVDIDGKDVQVNATGTVTVGGSTIDADAAIINIDGTASSHFNLAVTSVGALTLTLSSVNSGSGDGIVDIYAGDTVKIGDNVASTVLLGKSAANSAIHLVDANHNGSTWTQGYITLSDATDEWDDLETNCGGEVSLLQAINLAFISGANLWQVVSGQLTPITGYATAGLDINATGTNAVTLDSAAASHFTVTGAGLTLSTVTSGNITIDSVNAFSIDGDASSTITVAGNSKSLSVQTTGTTGSQLLLSSAGDGVDALILDASTGGGIDANAAKSITLDAGDSSNFTVTGSAKTLTLAAAGGSTNQVIVSSAGIGANAIYFNASAGGVDVDAAGAITLNSATASNFTVSGATADLTFGARAATITLNESGNTTLSGFTATSIVGALNEVGSRVKTNAGNPEGSLAGNVGDICIDTTNTLAYIKTSGVGNTGWSLAG